jgi:hypothetical protein
MKHSITEKCGARTIYEYWIGNSLELESFAYDRVLVTYGYQKWKVQYYLVQYGGFVVVHEVLKLVATLFHFLS